MDPKGKVGEYAVRVAPPHRTETAAWILTGDGGQTRRVALHPSGRWTCTCEWWVYRGRHQMTEGGWARCQARTRDFGRDGTTGGGGVMAKTRLVKDDAPALGPFRLSGVGLDGVEGDPSFDQWAAAVRTMKTCERSLMWLIGDLLVYGEDKYGEAHAQVLEAADYSEETCRVARWVARAFPKSRRVESLTFKHHQHVAALPAEDADRILSEAAADGLSSRDVRAKVLALSPPEPVAQSVTRVTEDAPDEPVEVSDDPAKCAATAEKMQRYLKKARNLFSVLFSSPYADAAKHACAGYTRCTPEATGERVKVGELGPVAFGPAEYTNDAFDELLACGGGLRAAFERLNRPEVPGEARGEWEAGQ